MPPTVQKVWKVKGKGNMIVLTFYGSCLPDYIYVGPLRLNVKPFLDRPLQCFNCFDFGHGRKHCTSAPRCGRCSSMDSHSMDECNKSPYCFHCRSDHQLRSRDCPRYRLEQDVLHLANANFISIGSARRELSHRYGQSGVALSYASTLGSRPSAQVSGSQLPHSHLSLSPVSTGVSTTNRFAVLTDAAAIPAASYSQMLMVPNTHSHPWPRGVRGERILSRRLISAFAVPLILLSCLVCRLPRFQLVLLLDLDQLIPNVQFRVPRPWAVLFLRWKARNNLVLDHC